MDIDTNEPIAAPGAPPRGRGRGAWRGLLLLVGVALLLAQACGVRATFEDLDEDHDGVMLGDDCAPRDATTGSVPLYADKDGDGHGVPPQVGVGCEGDRGVSVVADDCDDQDGYIWEDSTWYLDNDRDGFGVDPGVALCASEAVGYARVPGDCLDDDPGAFPGAPTSCDGDDNDCDGAVDADCTLPEGEISPSEADWWVTGATDTMAGASISPAGDVDCDGLQDVAVGAPGWAAGDGAVELIYGSAEALLHTLGEESARVALLTGSGEGFGVTAGGGADFDGDGCDDLLIGAPWAGGLSGGHGGVGGWGDSGADGRLNAVLGPVLPATGAVDELWSVGVLDGDGGGQLGSTIRCGGDLFGDGGADCLAGGPLWSLEDEDELGAVFVLNPPLLGGDEVAEVADLMVVGTTALERLGAAVAYGDVDGDGVDDLVMGAPTDVMAEFPDHDTKIGRAYVVWDVPSGAYDAEGLADTWVEGVESEDGAGLAVATGDLDGDGYDDLAVGAPRWDDAAGDEGRLTLYTGATLTTAEAPLSDADAFAVLTGGDAGAALGTSVELLADMSGDERAELLVGAPGADGTRGAALLFIEPLSGAVTEDAALLRVEGSGSGDNLGRAVGGVDVNGLGYEDLLIGGSGEVNERIRETGFVGAGQALVVFMDAW